MRTYLNRRARCSLSAIGAASWLMALLGVAPATAEQVVYAFQGGNDGRQPYGGLVIDNSGILYGTTSIGGGGACQFGGCGTVFKLAPNGTETVLYAFQGGNDGAYPEGNLYSDGAGNLYGTTAQGGASNNGTVFKTAADGAETVLYTFQGGADGWTPRGGLVSDNQGNLFGTTTLGGDYAGADCNIDGCGTVFEFKSGGQKVTIYAFQGGNDGAQPTGNLVGDGNGNFYGTTSFGGTGTLCGGSAGCGTIFKISANGTDTVLYSFKGGSDGSVPFAGLVRDNSGNLYGTTAEGGTCHFSNDCGVVFKLAANGTESVVYSFKGGNDGWSPEASLILDKTGNLYSTTYFGGGTHCGGNGCGTVFKLAPNGTETVLFAFHARDGRWPAASLLQGPNGQLYGTTTEGGINNNGVVFRVKK